LDAGGSSTLGLILLLIKPPRSASSSVNKGGVVRIMCDALMRSSRAGMRIKSTAHP
jgi:hypothetical protein